MRDEVAKEAARRQEQILARTLVSEAHPPRTHEDYQIGVICALATEKAAMVAILDDPHPKSKKENGDDNEYTLGRIGVHNIVIACLRAGSMGNGPAAIVAFLTILFEALYCFRGRRPLYIWQGITSIRNPPEVERRQPW